MTVIVLTGTNGGLGRTALRVLLAEKLVPASDLRISSANPARVPDAIRQTGIGIRQGDLYDGASLAASYAGADVLFLVSFPSMGEERYALHRAAIDAAKKAGVRHVVYTSLSFCGGAEGMESVAQVAHAHLLTEAYLRESGMTWTVLRMGSYQHLWNNYAGFLKLDAADGIVQDAVLPNDGLEHWVSREDLGEGCARVIADWQNYINKTLNFTGPELLTGVEIVNKYIKHTGRSVHVRVLPLQEAIKWHAEHGSVPQEQVAFLDNWASWHTAIAKGEKAFLDPTLERLLGRKPKSFDDVAHEVFSPANELDTKDLVGI